MRPFHELSINEAEKGIREGELSPTDLAKSLLRRIDEVEPRVKAFVTIDKEGVLESAEIAEREAKEGKFRGPLHGIPLGVKDVINTEGIRTTSGSPLRRNFVPSRDADAVWRLKQAGALVIGKTVTHEWAFEVFCPPTRNPWDLSRIPGGSSGGSAAAVAAEECPGAIGTDGGGSLRIPASLCGIVGLKPTFGLVSEAGTTPGGWSLSHMGPMTRTVRDAALLLNVVAGEGMRHLEFGSSRPTDYTKGIGGSIEGMRVGIPSNHFFEMLDGRVAECVKSALEFMLEKGAKRKEISVRHVEYCHPALLAIGLTEPADYHEAGIRAHPESYGLDVRTEFQIGALIPGKYYVKAQRFRTLFRMELERVFESVDVLLTPTVPASASRIGQKFFNFGGVKEGVSDTFPRYCLPFNLSGNPAITVPCGLDEDNLPIGVQIVGRAFGEEMILRAAQSLEQSIGWSKHRPPIR